MISFSFICTFLTISGNSIHIKRLTSEHYTLANSQTEHKRHENLFPEYPKTKTEVVCDSSKNAQKN